MSLSVALVSMPWPLADRPSIQLATLQAYLHQQFQGAVQVRAFHPYLTVASVLGFTLYQTIAEHTWLAEAIYAPLLFPEQRNCVQDLVRQVNVAARAQLPPDITTISNQLQQVHEKSPLFEELTRFDLVGISVCLAQLTASLYLVRELKRRAPHLHIVLGGSAVCGSMGKSLLEAFADIDWIINGEGERPLMALVQSMHLGKRPDAKEIEGLFTRTGTGEIAGGGRAQLTNLDSLPYPSYDDYFQELRNLPQLGSMIGSLPVESSRGCYWHRVRPENPQQGCQFCNLNLQWHGYRTKHPLRVTQELKHLSDKYRSLRFHFVDNALPPGTLEELCQNIQQLDTSLSLFAELRAPLTRMQFLHMRLAGVKQVQIGIEALSTKLLDKMHKGTTAIENIEMMKRCEEFGILNLSNLLLEFPGSDGSDVEETMQALEFVQCYQPLRIVCFWLGAGSPIHLQPELYGLRDIRNHRWYQYLFPGEVLAKLQLMQKSYRGDRMVQKKLWRPLAKQVRIWQKQYRDAKKQHPADPLLGYSDGGTFLVIRRRKAEAKQHEAYRLFGKSRGIYLYCDTRQTLAKIRARFPHIRSEKIVSFLNDLVSKRLMYREGQNYLSLAVNEDIRRFTGGVYPEEHRKKLKTQL